MHIIGAALSDRGKVRSSNEDSFVADVGGAVFLVADGMGGHAAGEVASHLTAKAAAEALAGCAPGLAPAGRLQAAVRQANEQVYGEQERAPECRGMGSTLTLLTFDGDGYHLAQVGDSRAYLFRDGELRQLSRDHSVVWPLYEAGDISKDELAKHPRKHLVTRCIGTHPDVDADLYDGPVREGDMFLLCSDGLTDVLTDGEIQCVLRRCGHNPKKACKDLVRAANDGGGPDNVTVVVVAADAGKPRARSSLHAKIASAFRL
ncbi:MAG: Stp1/IreP family PP2C-type Ser/Thr phosphatase [Acidobacteriota bacterium]|nr:Stp1/IreP family PP2C-type Ser/Thr phosphatase [Acidobacteriota bacterium]